MDTPIQLTADDWATLERGEPLRVRTGAEHELVVILAEQYAQLKQSAQWADADPKALYPLVANVSPEDWEDLAAYPQAERL